MGGRVPSSWRSKGDEARDEHRASRHEPSLSWHPSRRVRKQVLEEFGIPCEITVVSAHRTPERMMEYARTAHKRGLKAIIAGAGALQASTQRSEATPAQQAGAGVGCVGLLQPGRRRVAVVLHLMRRAGGAAHLPGMVAAMTPLPVIGVPVKPNGAYLDGMDALLSIVQMPKGVPVSAATDYCCPGAPCAPRGGWPHTRPRALSCCRLVCGAGGDGGHWQRGQRRAAGGAHHRVARPGHAGQDGGVPGEGGLGRCAALELASTRTCKPSSVALGPVAQDGMRTMVLDKAAKLEAQGWQEYKVAH